MDDKLLYDYALSFLGLPYRWGGDDPLAGFDCSGLVCELLMAAGKLPHKSDLNAQGLWDRFILGGKGMTTQPTLGCLSFYGKDFRDVSHVGMCLDSRRIIEAGGGTSTTTTRDAAIAANAVIRVRPIQYRKDFLGCLNV